MRGERFLSQPIRVHWAGWESDTYRLQQMGWEIAAHQDVVGGRMQIALKHPKGHAMGISEVVPFDYRGDRDWTREFYGSDFRVNFHDLARTINIHHHGAIASWPSFELVDAMPQVSAAPVTRLEDLVHFAGPKRQSFILPEETVPDLMERILKLQQPAREAHFLREAKLPPPRFQAQILSLPSAA